MATETASGSAPSKDSAAHTPGSRVRAWIGVREVILAGLLLLPVVMLLDPALEGVSRLLVLSVATIYTLWMVPATGIYVIFLADSVRLLLGFDSIILYALIRDYHRVAPEKRHELASNGPGWFRASLRYHPLAAIVGPLVDGVIHLHRSYLNEMLAKERSRGRPVGDTEYFGGILIRDLALIAPAIEQELAA